MKLQKLYIFFIIITLIVSVCSLAFLFNKKKPLIYLTLEELSQFNGENEQPAYVAVDGLIYDLSKCRYWKEGVHTESPEDAIAGRDMTQVLLKSSHGIKRVKGYPHVGHLVNSQEDKPVLTQEN